jgi:hypothetical protein
MHAILSFSRGLREALAEASETNKEDDRAAAEPAAVVFKNERRFREE